MLKSMQKLDTEKIKLVFKARKILQRHWLKLTFVAVAIFSLLLPYMFFNNTGALLVYDGYRYVLEIANSSESRQKGLAGRDKLAMNHGMLFVFDEPGRNCFWMKDMLISLDIMWLDSQYRVLHIEQNVQPDTYPSEHFCYEGQSKYVIELNAGEVKKSGIKVGVDVKISE